MEKNGGRIEKRTAYVTQDIDWLNNKDKDEPRKAISGIFKRNLFDISNLSEFIRFIVALNNVTELLSN